VVPADLVRIKIKMHEGTEFLTITCAVVENLNYQLILGSDMVDKLNRQLINDKNESAELLAVDISDDVLICDEDANDVVSNCDNDGCDDANPDDIADKNYQITGISADNESFDPKKATAEILKNDQRTGKSLAQCWSLAERDKAGYFVKDGILYRH